MFEYQKYLDQLNNRRKEIEGEVDAKNPFDSGIMKAVKSAKTSLGLDQDQEHKAIRKGLFKFSDALTQQYGDPRYSKRKGVINNLASVAPAIAKGLEGYEDASDKIQHDNREVYEWAKKFRDSEIKRLREQDQEAFDRYFADKKLGLEEAKIAEQRDYHKGMLDNKHSAISNKEPAYNKDIRSANLKNVSELRDTVLSDMALVETLNDLEEAFNEAKKAGYIGSSYEAAARRKLAKSIGDTKHLDLIKAAEAAYLHRVKQGGGSNPSTYEFTEILKTIPSSDKHYDASMAILQKDRNNAIRRLKDYNDYTNKLKETKYLLDPTINVDSYINNIEQNKNNTNKSVILYDPVTNEYFNVPEIDLADIEQENPQLVRK
jgi:uncharacterized protein YdaT